MRKTYGVNAPHVDPGELTGKLIVIEGPDYSGRTTQVNLLTEYLEHKGYACVQTGLNRSTLVAEELEEAKKGTGLSPRTFSLFYATDFADQLINVIVPALRAGFIVIADRYIYTPMARDLVRGADYRWLQSIYAIALVPDEVFYLSVSVNNLIERAFANHDMLHYWESGMDTGASRDWYDSFMRYQRKLRTQFLKLGKEYGFQIINGNRRVRTVANDLRTRVDALLAAQNVIKKGGEDAYDSIDCAYEKSNARCR